jgi:hypothetical protein
LADLCFRPAFAAGDYRQQHRLCTQPDADLFQTYLSEEIAVTRRLFAFNKRQSDRITGCILAIAHFQIAMDCGIFQDAEIQMESLSVADNGRILFISGSTVSTR